MRRRCESAAELDRDAIVVATLVGGYDRAELLFGERGLLSALVIPPDVLRAEWDRLRPRVEAEAARLKIARTWAQTMWSRA